jgi:hypothetical protein
LRRKEWNDETSLWTVEVIDMMGTRRYWLCGGKLELDGWCVGDLANVIVGTEKQTQG